MVKAATFAVAAAVATSAFAAPALEARRRGGGRAPSRPSQSSRTDKIAAGIGAAQVATDIAGLVIPKRDLEFVEVEARRRRGGGSGGRRSGPRSSTTDKINAGIGAAQVATDIAGLVAPREFEFEELEARRRRGGGGPRSSRTDKITAGIGAAQVATDVAGLFVPKRDLEFVEVEARRRRGGGSGGRRSGPRSSTTDKINAGIGAAQVATDIAGLVAPRDFEELEARRRRAGGASKPKASKPKAPKGRGGPRSSTTDKINAGIGAAQVATDIAGLVTAREFDLEMLD